MQKRVKLKLAKEAITKLNLFERYVLYIYLNDEKFLKNILEDIGFDFSYESRNVIEKLKKEVSNVKQR